MATRSEWLAVRVAEGEKQLIIAAARARGLTVSTHVRDVAVEASANWLEATEEPRSEEDRGA